MRQFRRSVLALGWFPLVVSGCIRRIETLEPTPCLPPEPSPGQSAIAWTALAQQPRTVVGRVLRAGDGAPPGDAVIRLWPDSTIHHLSADGTFRLDVADSGRRILDVRAIGF